MILFIWCAFGINIAGPVGSKGLPDGSGGKEFACNAGDPGSIPGLGISPGRKWRQSTAVFLPGEFHGRRSLVGYSPWGHKESDMTE